MDSLSLPPAVLKRLYAAGLSEPTRVQRRALPALLAGTSCLVQAPSGEGKTTMLAMLAAAAAAPHVRSPALRAVLLAPTRELVLQTAAQVERFLGLRPVVAVPDAKERPGAAPVVVGTPGRVAHLVDKKAALDLRHVALVVMMYRF